MTGPTTGALIDHLVVVAPDLASGAAWCEATLGVVAATGGEHPLMGTHNRLLRIATADQPRAYLELIAIDPGADARARMPGARWFDMDSPALQARVARDGPQLAHFVASVPNLRVASQALRAQGIDRGEIVNASRMTPRGLLQWQITVRADGQRLFDGTLPALIEWGEVHPTPALPDCGVQLQSLVVTHPQAAALRRAYEAIGLQAVDVREGPPELCATLITPRGPVQLSSGGL